MLNSGMPPSCVPGMNTDLTTGLNDFVAAGTSADQGTISGIQLATTQVVAGGDAIKRATTDLNNYTASH